MRVPTKLRVTFFVYDYADVSGGHNTWLTRFLPTLRQRDIDVRVLCCETTPGLPTARSLQNAGFPCAVMPEHKLKYTKRRVRWILARLLEHPPDIFVINAVYPPAYYAARWLREAGIPTIGICHGMMSFYEGLLDQFVEARSPYQVSAMVCVSTWLLRDVMQRHPQCIFLHSIPCGVRIPATVAKAPNGRLRLAYVGRLTEEYKQISAVVRGFCRVVREVEGTEAVIYGDGPARSAVEHILRVEGAGLPVQLAGFVENKDIMSRLLDCHAVVLLSDREGLGISLLEGMACGAVPLAMRGAPGVMEFVIDNQTGLLVDDRGDAFVAAVRRLRQDPMLWERLSRAARAKVAANYSEQICVTRWQALFHEIRADYLEFGRWPLRIPSRLHLPPVHPSLAWLDSRPPHQELIRRARRLAGRVRRFCLGVRHEDSSGGGK
jgi:glycosyltransferase involved in cell wall biosynthesis